MLQSKIIPDLSLILLHLRRFAAIFGLVAGTAIGSAAAADRPVFDLPIDCTVGDDCWLVNLVDRDPGPGRTDYRCGTLSYDNHRGTDIAVANRRVMRSGVNVLAAADGVVLRTRDGVPPTTAADLRNRANLNGRECGNGVVIDHGDGWTGQYCHLKAGSLIVSPGSRVVRGQPLAEVGLTGLTQFPHVHFTVRRGATVIDPFTGDSQVAACSPRASAGDGLWSAAATDALAYPGPQLYHLGFAPLNPDPADVREGAYSRDTFSVGVPALVFWAEVFGVGPGDVLTIRLTGPSGELIADNSLTVDRPQARRFAAVGRKKRGQAWPPGVYVGEIEVARNGLTVRRSATATLQAE